MLEPNAIQQVETGTSIQLKPDVMQNSFNHSASILFLQSPISKNPLTCHALNRSNIYLQSRPSLGMASARKRNPAKVQIRGGSKLFFGYLVTSQLLPM